MRSNDMERNGILGCDGDLSGNALPLADQIQHSTMYMYLFTSYNRKVPVIVIVAVDSIFPYKYFLKPLA
jgi:hypothetical protein